MPESVLVNKAESYLEEIAKDSISVDYIENFDNFKSLYFKLDDRLNTLQSMKDDMDAQGFAAPFASISKYGTKAGSDIAKEEIGDTSHHNQIFWIKANAKKNILDRVKSAIDSHKIAIGNLEQFGYVKCNSCYKKYSMSEYKQMGGICTCGNQGFTFKIKREATHRIEIIPHLPLSGNYMVLISEFSSYGRESLKQVLNILKQERKGVVKTVSLRVRFKDKNNRLIRRTISLGSEYVDNYEEEVRKRFGKTVRIEKLTTYRTKPAILDDKHARTALAIGYVRYAEEIISDIGDDILKRNVADFKRINKYDEIIAEYENQTPDFIDKYDTGAIESWRKSQIQERFKSLNYCDGHGNIKRSLSRDLKKRENIYKNTLKNIAPALIIWYIFRYYMTTSNNSRRIDLGPFPYIRVELDREQRKVFQETYSKVIETLKDFTDIKIIPIEEKDLLLYEKFKFEKQMRNSHIRFDHVALGVALINENSDIPLEAICNAFNINKSRVNKEIENIEGIRNPKSAKSEEFLEELMKM